MNSEFISETCSPNQAKCPTFSSPYNFALGIELAANSAFENETSPSTVLETNEKV